MILEVVNLHSSVIGILDLALRTGSIYCTLYHVFAQIQLSVEVFAALSVVDDVVYRQYVIRHRRPVEHMPVTQVATEDDAGVRHFVVL